MDRTSIRQMRQNIPKETAPIIYKNEYLGLETGDGGNVFEKS